MINNINRIEDVLGLLGGAVPEVFETMLTMHAMPAQPGNLQALDGSCVTGSAGFIGEVSALVSIHVTPAFARSLAGRMLGIAEEDFDGDEMINDAIAELSNMVVGAVKSRLCDDGLPCALTLPTVARGGGFRAATADSPDRRLLVFRCGVDQLVVELLMTPSNVICHK